ncbi:MAG TPA: hypothetical protein VK563_21065 [Puia sp.]|nr:hypothetical protein [Puia sp.]
MKKTKEQADKEAMKPLLYPDKEDIYNQDTKLPEDAVEGIGDGDGPESESPGSDLDVPGSELDDEDEKIGEEDEENNYYSLGGDDHDDLEEDKGD